MRRFWFRTALELRGRPATVRAAVSASLFSGLPSTVHALVTRRDPLEGSVAAGSILLPRETRRAQLLLASVPVHAALSMGWAVVLAYVLPRRNPIAEGSLAGIAIAGLDLGIIGRRYPRIRALPALPQIVDHIAFGIITAMVLSRHAADR
jgi:hypothetical protein